jgi:hypothetical protein
MTQLFKIAAIAMALFGVSARADVNPMAEQLKRDIVFQTMVKTPNELDEAVVPYLDCMMEKSGTKRVDSGEGEPPSSSPTPDECTGLRNKADSEADSKLKSMGIENLDDRRAIIFNTLLAIDLAAQGSTAWLKDAK